METHGEALVKLLSSHDAELVSHLNNIEVDMKQAARGCVFSISY
jgi:hypothetical protein